MAEFGSLIKVLVEQMEKVKTVLQVGVVAVALLLFTLAQTSEHSASSTISLLCLSLIPLALVLSGIEPLNQHYKFIIYLLFIGWSFFVGWKFSESVAMPLPVDVSCETLYTQHSTEWQTRYEAKQLELQTAVLDPVEVDLQKAKTDAEMNAVADRIIDKLKADSNLQSSLESMLQYLDLVTSSLESSKCKLPRFQAFFDNKIYNIYGNYGPFIKYARGVVWPESVGEATEARFKKIFHDRTFQAAP